MDATASVRSWLLRILCAALVMRVLIAVGLDWKLSQQEPPPLDLIAGDAEGYWDLAGDLASGREYAVYEPPRRALRMPGFPALLAPIRWAFGDATFPARMLLAVVGTLGCWCVWRLGADLFDPITGLMAAAAAAVSPAFNGFSVLLLSETTFAVTLLLSLLAGVKLVRCHVVRCQIVRCDVVRGHVSPTDTDAIVNVPLSRRWLWAVLTGMGIALACYVRPSWLLAAPIFGGLLIVTSRRRGAAVADTAVLHLALFLSLLPWGLRNERATGHFVLTTLWMGPSLYDGLRPDANGDSDMTFFDRDNVMGRGLSEYEMDRHYRRLAWVFVRENPVRTVELAAIKLWRYWKPWPNAEQFGGWVPALVLGAFGVPMLGFAAFAAGMMGQAFRRGSSDERRWMAWQLAMTAGPVVYFAALHAVFVSSLRYRLPGEYALLVLSAVGVRLLMERKKFVGSRSVLSQEGEV